MEAHQLTVWEQKERAGLLALETDEWREKRLLAEDPSATADIMTGLAQEVNAAWETYADARRKAARLLAEALAAHPNTPPPVLAGLIDRFPLSCKAFCRNPVTPFLILEDPNFVASLTDKAQHSLLREANAPPLFVHMLATGNAAKEEAVRKSACFHVAFAVKEFSSRAEWEQELRAYWQAECAAPQNEFRQQWHADFAETGIAPSWAQGGAAVPLAKQDVSSFVADAVTQWLRFEAKPDSMEEAQLFEAIAASARKNPLVARGLRANATDEDLIALLHAPGSIYFALAYAVSLHPAANERVLREMAGSGDPPKHDRILAYHPKTPPDVVARLLQSRDAGIRRITRRHPNAPPNALAIARHVLLSMDYGMSEEIVAYAAFISFVECLLATKKQKDVSQSNSPKKVQHFYWTSRLEAALLANVDNHVAQGEQYERTGNDLLYHLIHDGNRFVRWAAQTRLADPDFVFTWADDGTINTA